MSSINPAQTLHQAPIADIISLLIKQFKRLFADNAIILTSDDIETLAQAAATYQPLPASSSAMLPVLRNLIVESVSVLETQFSFSFAESLGKDMNDVQGWESTSEFLDLANAKSNAELRISTGAALLTLLGDATGAGYCLAVIDDDAGAFDVDATIAYRALLHLARLAPDTPAWRTQVEAYLAQH